MNMTLAIATLSGLALAGSAFAQTYNNATNGSMTGDTIMNAEGTRNGTGSMINGTPGLPDTGGGWGANR